jgi:hypothetical protein
MAGGTTVQAELGHLHSPLYCTVLVFGVFSRLDKWNPVFQKHSQLLGDDKP